MVESVDTRDLKSLGHCGCAGSSPASSTSILFFERLYEYRFMKPHLFLLVYYVRLTPESTMVKKLFNFI